MLGSLKNTAIQPSTQLLVNILHPAPTEERTVYSAPIEGDTGNPGQHLATEEQAHHASNTVLDPHRTRLLRTVLSAWGKENKGITPAEMRRAQGYVGDWCLGGG